MVVIDCIIGYVMGIFCSTKIRQIEETLKVLERLQELNLKQNKIKLNKNYVEYLILKEKFWWSQQIFCGHKTETVSSI